LPVWSLLAVAGFWSPHGVFGQFQPDLSAALETERLDRGRASGDNARM